MDIYVVSQVTSNEGGYNVGVRRTLEDAQELAATVAKEALTWSAQAGGEWWGSRSDGDWMQIDHFEI